MTKLDQHLTREKLLLASKLLDLAAEQFSNHGCNEFDLLEQVPELAKKLKPLVDAHHLETCEGFKAFYDQYIYADWMLMNWLSDELKAAASEEPDEAMED